MVAGSRPRDAWPGSHLNICPAVEWRHCEMNSTTMPRYEGVGGGRLKRDAAGADQLDAPPESARAGSSPDRPVLAMVALALTGIVAFVPSLLSWTVAWRFHTIPRLPAVRSVSFERPSTGPPLLVGAESAAAAPDGTLVVADWARRAVLTVRANGTPVWQQPRGRFLPQFSSNGFLHLLDIDTGYLSRFTASGELDRRTAVAPPGAATALCVDEDGRVLVAAAGTLNRFGADLRSLDPSWGHAGKLATASELTGLAAREDRVWAASRENRVLVFSADGVLLRDEPFVANAGPLAMSPNGTLVLADRRTARVFILDHQGRVRGRLVSTSGKAPVSSLRGLAFLTERTLAVATSSSIEVLTLPELP